ncbi:MAG: hypothetical protein KatS3mg103_1208 [Phycisphaerales bacterium]|nr:MAG: hypothetical protein KatS3mg103_1208 [Phycisphaerales bacterium]
MRFGQTTNLLGGPDLPPPGPLERLKDALLTAVMLVLGAAVLAGIVAVGLVLLPIALLAGAVGWWLIRRRLARALAAMGLDTTTASPWDPSAGNDRAPPGSGWDAVDPDAGQDIGQDAAGRENVRIRRARHPDP